jgi:hypothetical protein
VGARAARIAERIPEACEMAANPPRIGDTGVILRNESGSGKGVWSGKGVRMISGQEKGSE